MLRKLLGAGLLLATLAGCTELVEGAKCDDDADCADRGGLCNVGLGLCYTEPEETNCTPACAAYQACTSGGCRPRFTALNILTPADNAVVGGGPVQVSAQLVKNVAYADTTEFPASIDFRPENTGGGEVGSFSAVTLDGDTYTATWTPPAGEAQFVLSAAHPSSGAALRDTVNVTVDAVPPTFTIAFPNAPLRNPGTATQQADERDPTAGYEGAFRRDEVVTVQISANEQVSDVTLTVVGIGPGGAAGQAQPAVTVQPGGTCDGAPVFCGNVVVDLSTPEMRDVRGTMDFRVEGQDAVGNRNSASAGLKVTRWKWAFDSGGNILSTPAIGNRGTVYVGTSAVGNGKTYAVGPDGAKKWEFASGDVSGSPAVGGFASNEEYVYVGGKSASGSFLYALQWSNGLDKARCSLSNPASDMPGAIAVGMTPVTAGMAETGVVIYNGSQLRIVQVRPAVPSGEQCLEVVGGSVLASVPGGSLVMKDQNIFYGAGGSRIISFDLSGTSNSARTGWPQSTNSLVRGLALTGDQLYGAAANSDDPGQGSLFTIPTSSGTPSFVYPTGNTSRVFNVSIGASNVAFFGAETGGTVELLSLGLGVSGAMPLKASGVGTLRGAPVIGKNDLLYTLNTQGKVTAWTASTITPLWNLELALGLAKDVSPTLDCRREGSGAAVAGPGTLYIPGETKVYALIVDSPGMDPAAPWPKYQRDARNTGNPATPITNCP